MSNVHEFDRAIVDIIAGERQRMDALDRDLATIKTRAIAGLQVIEAAINAHPTTGGAKRLVRFLAGATTERTILLIYRSCGVSTRRSPMRTWII